MARISPFKALIPVKGLEDKVSANTHVDDIIRQTQIVLENPYSYLHVVKPHLKFKEEKNPDKHFPFAEEAFRELLEKKAITMDEKDSFYVYIMVDKQNNGREYIGLICTVPVEDYFDKKIKIHEKTLTEKEEQLIMHIEHTGVIGEPVLMTHPESNLVSDILRKYAVTGKEIVYFHDEVGRIHKIMSISDADSIAELVQAYGKVGDLYIADGHHRSAASAGYFKKHEIANGRYLTYIVPPEYLHIDSFHRAFKSAVDFDANTFLAALSEDFEISNSEEAVKPEHESVFGLLLKNQWYKLNYKSNSGILDAVSKLDVSVLEEKVFKKVLHIQDSKTDKQLTFLKGNIPYSKLETDTAAGVYDAVFTVHPCTIQQVFDVADQGLIMPPKSTYIEPKLRTGLTVQRVLD